MKLIVGLGNPGEKYEQTRHNIGWQVIDSFLDQEENFKKNKKALCFYLKKQIANQESILVKPLTFMNNSGQSVAAWQKTLNLNPEDIIVIHDDGDINLTKIRISQNRSAGGHKGVESIINHLGTKNFIRLRVGIKPEREIKVPLEKFVLKKFSQEEKKQLLKIIENSKQAIIHTLEKGLNSSMSKYN
jgi:peptidyl-tRNA hydrolase, PTH1 family